MRRLSDRICLENELSVITNPKLHSKGRFLHYGAWLGAERQSSYKEQLRLAINEALAKRPADFDAFLRLMEASGYTVKHGRGGTISFLVPGQERATRLRASTLGAGFDPADIRDVIAGKRPIPEIPHEAPAPRKVSLVIDIQERLCSGKGPAYERWAKVYNLKQMAAALMFLQEHQLTEYDLVPEEWGGDVICVPVSAKTHMGIDKLLESILLVAEMLELKANPNRAAKGIVIEAKLDKGRGPVATLLVQNGTLRTGDIVVAGTTVGRVRVMTNERGKKLEEAGPSVPVEVMGLDEVPTGGDKFDAVSDEKLARELVEQRKHEQKEEQFKQFQKVTLDNLFSSINEGELKELNIIVKADVQGSVEAVRQSLEKLSNDEVKVKVIHGGVGAVSESDVMLAAASNAIIVGFNVRPDSVAESIAERDGVDMRMYRIIYDCIEEISDAIKGMLAPKYREVTLGKAEVRNVFKLSSAGMIAGSYVLDGKITRNSQIRVVRDGIVVSEDSIASLKRFKDDVKEVQSGYECGIGLEKFNDIKEGDILEAFVMEEYKD